MKERTNDTLWEYVKEEKNSIRIANMTQSK